MLSSVKNCGYSSKAGTWTWSISMWAIKAKISIAAALVHEHAPNIWSEFDLLVRHWSRLRVYRLKYNRLWTQINLPKPVMIGLIFISQSNGQVNKSCQVNFSTNTYTQDASDYQNNNKKCSCTKMKRHMHTMTQSEIFHCAQPVLSFFSVQRW